MDGYYVVGVTPIPYPRFGVITNIVFKEDIPMSQRLPCSTRSKVSQCHNWRHPALRKRVFTSFGKGKGNGYITNIFMRLDLCARWIMMAISSFVLQHTPTRRSCDYLNLHVLSKLWICSTLPWEVPHGNGHFLSSWEIGRGWNTLRLHR